MARFLIIGALALDRPIRLEASLRVGGRVGGASLEGRLAGRLGGGAANAGVALMKAGHQVNAASILAQDSEGAEALARAAAAGLDISLCVRRAGRSATTLILIEPDGERLVMGLDRDRDIVLPSLPPPPPRGGPAFEAVFIRAAYPGAANWARRGGITLLHWPTAAYDGPVDVVVASVDDLPPEVLADPLGAARGRHGDQVRWIVLTRGADGAQAVGAEGRVSCPAPPAKVADATGAGDIFAAGLLEALAAGAPMDRALAHACAWGAAAVAMEASAPLDAGPDSFAPYR
ncbi:PfkB family carbohydrate kinase [Phenylobacterium sp.]|uniref:PfkB family carbohydrate kinase n=1 Tax=Phenylobacterium sp. TaxID=1871053 RepID=UPI002FD9D11E